MYMRMSSVPLAYYYLHAPPFNEGEDACNQITLMCLKACRRLPLNAPCISLRLTKSTPLEVKQAAVDALLSGGAHPILYHDEKMIEGTYSNILGFF